jgi:ELWxxDGT repeat protein
LYFSAEDGVTGRELWKTDGTETGTMQVKDLCPGSCDGLPVLVILAGTNEALRSTK